MQRHPFDTASAALGVVVVVVAALLLVSADVSWWLALIAMLLGLAVIPWAPRRRVSRPDKYEL
jgi:hypothetical protein